MLIRIVLAAFVVSAGCGRLGYKVDIQDGGAPDAHTDASMALPIDTKADATLAPPADGGSDTVTTVPPADGATAPPADGAAVAPADAAAPPPADTATAPPGDAEAAPDAAVTTDAGPGEDVASAPDVSPDTGSVQTQSDTAGGAVLLTVDYPQSGSSSRNGSPITVGGTSVQAYVIDPGADDQLDPLTDVARTTTTTRGTYGMGAESSTQTSSLSVGVGFERAPDRLEFLTVTLPQAYPCAEVEVTVRGLSTYAGDFLGGLRGGPYAPAGRALDEILTAFAARPFAGGAPGGDVTAILTGTGVDRVLVAHPLTGSYRFGLRRLVVRACP